MALNGAIQSKEDGGAASDGAGKARSGHGKAQGGLVAATAAIQGRVAQKNQGRAWLAGAETGCQWIVGRTGRDEKGQGR